MASLGRVEVPELDAPQSLRVPQVSGDTYAPPPKPAINNDMERLAQALSGFSATIGRLAHDPAAKKAQEDARLAEVNRFIASATDPQLRQAVARGEAPHASDPVSSATYAAVLGQRAGQDFETRTLAEFGPGGGRSLLNPDGSPIDVDAYVSGQAKAYLDNGGLPGSVHALEKFRTSTEGLVVKLREQQRTAMAEDAGKRRDAVIATGFGNVIQNGELAGLPPDQVASRVRTAYGELQGVTHATWAELDDKLVGQLKVSLDHAQATPLTARNVLAILDAPRNDTASGQDIGPLSRNPRFTDDVARLRASAQRVLSQDWENQTRSKVLQDTASTFTAQDGSFDAISDRVEVNPYTGKPFTVSAQETKDAVTGLFLTRNRARVEEQLRGQDVNVTARERFLSEAPVFIQNGRVQPEWRDTLQGAVKAAGNTTAMTDPAQATRLKGAANLYMSIRTISPAYLDKLVDRPTQDFFENYAAFRSMGQGDDTALRNAAVTIEPGRAQDPGITMRIQDIEKKVGVMDFNGWWPGTSTPKNWWEARNLIARQAQLLARAQGVSADDAIQAAQKNLAESAPLLNGRAVFERSPFFTKDKVPVFERMIRDQFDANRKALGAMWGIDAPGDISVQFTGGKYQLVRASDGMPLAVPHTDPNGSRRAAGMFFTDGDVRATEKQIDREKTIRALGQDPMGKAHKAADQMTREEFPWRPWWMQ